MTDFRELCAELVDAIDSGISTDRMHLSPLMLRTRTALAQPEPQGPSDEELKEWYHQWAKSNSWWGYGDRPVYFARAVLARWSRLANNNIKETH